MYTLRERVQTGEQTIVFAATRYHVEYLCELAIKAGFKANFIYGAMDQRAREDKLIEFRRKYTNFLFVTDLAARGIDIPFLENVIHFDFPTKLKLFIHRAGRTARAGRTGVSYGIVTQEELAYLHDLSIFVGRDHKDKCTQAEIEDPQIMCYGRLPQHLTDEYCFYVAKLYDTHETLLEPLKKSLKNSVSKYLKTRDPASAASVTLMKTV